MLRQSTHGTAAATAAMAAGAPQACRRPLAPPYGRSLVRWKIELALMSLWMLGVALGLVEWELSRARREPTPARLSPPRRCAPLPRLTPVPAPPGGSRHHRFRSPRSAHGPARASIPPQQLRPAPRSRGVRSVVAHPRLVGLRHVRHPARHELERRPTLPDDRELSHHHLVRRRETNEVESGRESPAPGYAIPAGDIAPSRVDPIHQRLH